MSKATASPGGGGLTGGLCDRCAWQRIVRTGRGSRFSLCERSRTDARFAKYPRIPVRECPGFEPVTAPGGP